MSSRPIGHILFTRNREKVVTVLVIPNSTVILVKICRKRKAVIIREENLAQILVTLYRTYEESNTCIKFVRVFTSKHRVLFRFVASKPFASFETGFLNNRCIKVRLLTQVTHRKKIIYDNVLFNRLLYFEEFARVS